MADQIAVRLAESLEDFRSFKAESEIWPFRPMILEHVYVKLDLEHRYENARTAEDAKLFLKSVARAVAAASKTAEQYGGSILEVQGSMIHAGLPLAGLDDAARALEFIQSLHDALEIVFQARSRVLGWRMTADTGKTLVVAGRGAHGDDSWVSLGPAANNPAKHLYSQLERPEDSRSLKRFHVGFFDRQSESWQYADLRKTSRDMDESRVIARKALEEEPVLRFFDVIGENRTILADAVNIGAPGTPGAPTADLPLTYYGWVMRSDLDGFISLVEKSIDDDARLEKLASDFYSIMAASGAFVDRHSESLIQLPWAGDNFTASAVFRSMDAYRDAVPKRLIELSLDFDKDLESDAKRIGSKGWAHGIAGGVPHGNAGGSIYVAGMEIGDRRFLVGAGEGFGRSIQAFADINPDAGEFVVLKDDWDQLDDGYMHSFTQAENTRGGQSSLFRIGASSGLIRARARIAADGSPTDVTMSRAKPEPVTPRHYYR